MNTKEKRVFIISLKNAFLIFILSTFLSIIFLLALSIINMQKKSNFLCGKFGSRPVELKYYDLIKQFEEKTKSISSETIKLIEEQNTSKNLIQLDFPVGNCQCQIQALFYYFFYKNLFNKESYFLKKPAFSIIENNASFLINVALLMNKCTKQDEFGFSTILNKQNEIAKIFNTSGTKSDKTRKSLLEIFSIAEMILILEKYPNNNLFCENLSMCGDYEILSTSTYNSLLIFLEQSEIYKIPIKIDSNVFFIKNKEDKEKIVVNQLKQNINIYSKNIINNEPFFVLNIFSIFSSEQEAQNINSIEKKIEQIGLKQLISFIGADHIQFSNDFILDKEKNEIIKYRNLAKENGCFKLQMIKEEQNSKDYKMLKYPQTLIKDNYDFFNILKQTSPIIYGYHIQISQNYTDK
jgi:hypothetical protein